MKELPEKALAFFTARAPRSVSDIEYQQEILRSCARRSHLQIMAFVALPKVSAERIFQALRLFQSYDARKLIVDAMDSFFMPAKSLVSFIDFLSENHLELVDASTDAFFKPSHLESLRTMLQTSILAEKANRGKQIRKSLRLKKRAGAQLGGKKFGHAPEEKEIVERIIALYNSGISLQKICSILSSSDVQSVYRKKWYPTTLKRIIEREKQ